MGTSSTLPVQGTPSIRVYTADPLWACSLSLVSICSVVPAGAVGLVAGSRGIGRAVVIIGPQLQGLQVGGTHTLLIAQELRAARLCRRRAEAAITLWYAPERNDGMCVARSGYASRGMLASSHAPWRRVMAVC